MSILFMIIGYGFWQVCTWHTSKTIPMQLAKENKKYIYGQVREGALTEQYVLQQFVSEHGLTPYYYSTPNSTGEIDFILQGKTSVVPVEVKAEENLRAKSLKAFCEKYHPGHAIRTSMSDYREQEWMTNLPLYDIGGIQKFLDD